MFDAPRQHYVYAHRKATDGSLFYIGKGKDRRAWQKYSRNRYWRHIAEKHGFTVEIVRNGLPEACALSLERAMIASAKSKLANQTDGGGGTSGWKHSEEAKARIGAHWRGRKLTQSQLEALKISNRNRVITEETRRRQSDAAKIRARRPHTPETRAKIANAHIGLRPSEASRVKMSVAKIGKATGRNSPSYDHTIRVWNNSDGRVFSGTRADFIATHNLADGCVSAAISGKRKSVKGWKLS